MVICDLTEKRYPITWKIFGLPEKKKQPLEECFTLSPLRGSVSTSLRSDKTNFPLPYDREKQISSSGFSMAAKKITGYRNYYSLYFEDSLFIFLFLLLFAAHFKALFFSSFFWRRIKYILFKNIQESCKRFLSLN